MMNMDVVCNVGRGLFFLLIIQQVLPSDSQRSHCAQCSDGTVCKTVRGILGITIMSKGYNPVVTIPAGACNVNVTEAARSANHLAMKTRDGDYLLNGRWIINPPGLFDVEGVAVVYARDQPNCPGECLKADGPLANELDIQLLYHSRSPGVYYTYQLPPNMPPSRPPNNLKQVQDVNTRFPGRGELREPEVGSQSFDTTDSPEVVSEEKPEVDPNTPGTFPVYSPYPSRSDIKRKGPIFSHEFTRFKSRKSDEPHVITKPANQEHRQALTDVTYSRGIDDVDFQIESEEKTSSSRDLSNVINREGVVYHQDNENITDGPVVSVLEKYSWKLSGFSECSRPCGGGIQESTYICVDTASLEAAATLNCENTIKPEVQYQVCNIAPCTPIWVEGPWSECSTSCGQGQMSRNVTCQQRMSATVVRPLQDEHCTSHKPAIIRACLQDNCYSWKVGEWGECSSPCNAGTRRRSIECVDHTGGVHDNENCDQSETPTAEESCDMGSCSANWYHSKWSGTCINSCGSGVVTRIVHCATDTGHVILDSHCDQSDRPKSEEACRQGVTCGGKWFAGPWSKCSQSCGEGVKTRQIVCMKKIGDQQVTTSDDNCVDDEKPGTTNTCTESDCGHTWFMTEWSTCSKTCGGGLKTRTVMCMKDGGMLSTLCDVSRRPENSIACNTNKCVKRRRQKKKGCVNKYPNCHVVVQANLCRYWYYQRKCCASCSGNLHGAKKLT